MSEICDAHKKVDVEQLYNWVHRKFNQLETRCGRESQHSAEGALRTPINQFGDQTSWREDAGMRTYPRESGLPGHRLSSPGERERNAVMWGSICCSSLRSPTPSHTQPFQIKWEVYFSNNCVACIYCVVMILHASAYEYTIRVLCKEKGCNLQDTFRLIGHAITMTS